MHCKAHSLRRLRALLRWRRLMQPDSWLQSDFGLHRAIPALKAAADGTVPADDFVKKFVLNGDVKELRAMADLLKKEAPESYAQARAQIGDELRRAGFRRECRRR